MDGGGNWEDVTPGGLPVDGTVNTLEVSAHEPGRVFLAVQRYRMDDYRPMIYRTNDYGQSWDLLTSGTNGIPGDHPVRVVREDPDRQGLLYAGTDFGLFLSFDDGEHWQSFRQNLPVTQVADLQVKEQDLVVATHGRSLWIMDDLTPLHQLAHGLGVSAEPSDRGRDGGGGPTRETAERSAGETSLREDFNEAPAMLYQPGLTYRLQRAGRGGDRAMQDPPNGAVIRYYLAEEPEKDAEVALTFSDSQGEEIRSFYRKPGNDDDPKVPAEAGMNVFVWNLTYPGLELPDGVLNYMGYNGGPTVVPGEYQVTLTVGEWSETQTLLIQKDPRLGHVTDSQLQEQQELGSRIRRRMEEGYAAIETIQAIREQAKSLGERAEKGGFGDELKVMADSLSAQLELIEVELFQTKAESGQDMINFPPQLVNQFGYVYGMLAPAYGPPTAQERARVSELEEELAMLRGGLQAILDTDLAAFNAKVRELGVGPVVLPKR
jgi:hypothetical protein